MQTFNAIKLAHSLLSARLSGAQCVVDATAGNGKDTLFLASSIPSNAIVWAFDIQEVALATTKKKLTAYHLEDKVHLILDSHARAADYVCELVDVAMFNLGYLPGVSHHIRTKPQSTVLALQEIVNLLSIGGLISVVAYPKYEAGQQEHHAVKEFLSGLPATHFTVGCWSMVNHTNDSPVLYVIEKGSEVREVFTSR
jgi:hypothetical protein